MYVGTANNRKIESHPWHRIWNIDSVLFVCVWGVGGYAVYCLLFVFISNFRKIIRTLMGNFCKPFPKIHQLFTFDGII